MQTGLLLLNVGLFLAAAVALGCVVWIVYRVLEEAGDGGGPDGWGRRRDDADRTPPLPGAPRLDTVHARRRDLARSA